MKRLLGLVRKGLSLFTIICISYCVYFPLIHLTNSVYPLNLILLVPFSFVVGWYGMSRVYRRLAGIKCEVRRS